MNNNKQITNIYSNIYISSIDDISYNTLIEIKIFNIILIDKYLEIEIPNEHKDKFNIMNLNMNCEEPNENFLFNFKSIINFISNLPSVFISEKDSSPLLFAIVIAYLISIGKRYNECLNLFSNVNINDILFEEYKKRLIDYDNMCNNKDPIKIFKCKICRKNLFTDKNVMYLHEFTPKEKYSNKRRKVNIVRSKECSSYFLNDFIEENENSLMKVENGKILCKKCGNKLGEFLPKGTQCSCGSWVVPAVQIIKSKVDEVKIS